MADKLYTLQEAVETIDNLVRDISGLLYVAAVDVNEVYGDTEISANLFAESPDTLVFKPSKSARRFARMLVERMVLDDEIILDYTPANEPPLED